MPTLPRRMRARSAGMTCAEQTCSVARRAVKATLSEGSPMDDQQQKIAATDGDHVRFGKALSVTR